MDTSFISKCLPNLEKDFLIEIEKHSSVKKFSAQDYIVKQGEYIRFLPIILSGNVKVFSYEEASQFLLYYISSGDACIFSFAHVYNENPLEFSAVAELESELLLLPIHKVNDWIKKYPSFSNLILKDYQKHYQDLLNTTKQIMYHNLEDRLLSYLNNKTQIENSNVLAISHQEIANDLGTSREVISRLMKKISADKKVIQEGRKIKVL